MTFVGVLLFVEYGKVEATRILLEKGKGVTIKHQMDNLVLLFIFLAALEEDMLK